MPKNRQALGSTAESTSVSSSADDTDDTVSTCVLLDRFRKQDGNVDYDYFYDNPNEHPVQFECSIVRHMLGQVKIGMDLSKITLPTFILERRSLLEMYADHFAHSQQFVAIADGETAYERMTAALRWYLTSFHAGRKYDVARKPYNPILGETFLCHYDLSEPSTPASGGSSSPSPKSAVTGVFGGPVPWANEDSITFYAEQVSHHPPVSAFYAEHLKKRIMCNAHVWTRSKFYGLSIGVINVGKAIVTLLDHNEEYVFTFPAAYARSIMTVPFVELGGSVTGHCPQTGFRAEIEFLTKSFYSSKRNRVTCKLFCPDNSIEVIDGDWSGTLRHKRASNQNQLYTVFADAAALPVSQKTVRPIAEQDHRESRYLWRNVTAALYVNDLNLATKYKRQIERMQREESSQRAERKLSYTSKHFRRVTTDDDTAWKYQPNLIDRLEKTDTQNLVFQ